MSRWFQRAAVVVIASGVGCAASSPSVPPLQLGVTWRGQEEFSFPSGRPLGQDRLSEPLRFAGSESRHDPSVSSPSRGSTPASRDGPADTTAHRYLKRWHIDLALRVSHTKLSSAEQTLDRRLDIPLRADIFGVYHRPTTTIDRKTNLGLNTIALGFGRTERDWFAWTVYGGFGVGVDRSHQRFLNQQLDINFAYGIYYAGILAEFYPWKIPEPAPRMSWRERFRRSRPYFVSGFELGYVSAEADGDFTVGPVTVYKDGVTIRDWIFSWPIGVGWAVPLNRRWSLQLVGDYRFHAYRPEEYNGWNVTVAFRRRL